MEQTPILLIIFNRADKVKRLIDTLRPVRPTRIYVSADGPRAHVSTDKERCDAAREAIKLIDWPCTVTTNFHDKNTGADHGPEKGIDWFFSQVEEGIVLEDDCHPHPDFFTFATMMLERYRDNPEIMMISGNNFQGGKRRGDASYYFSKYPSTWGWASWRRAWSHYHTKIDGYDDFVAQDILDTIAQSPAEKKYWSRFFAKIKNGELEHWDIKWIYAIWKNGGISITPNINLVKNVGFGPDATHTIRHDDAMVVRAQEIGTITHPKEIRIDRDADAYIFQNIYAFTLKKKILYALELVQRRLGIIK